MTSDGEPRHLHKAAILIDEVRSSLKLLGTVVVLAVVKSGSGLMFVLLVTTGAGIVLSTLFAHRAWRATTYWVDDVALHYRSGIFTPDTKLVPLARVQSVDTANAVLQRLFGVLELRVQVAGASDEEEIVLSAVTYEEAARLRRALGQPEPAPPDAIVRLGVRGLLLSALTGPQIAAGMSGVAAVYALLDNVINVQQDGEGLLQGLNTTGEIVLVVVGLLAGGYLVSFAAGIVLFAGFEAERDGAILRVRRGLLSRRVLSIPVARIDGVVIVEGLLRGPLGLASLQLESVSHGREDDVVNTLLPLVRRREAEAVIARLLPALTVAPGPLQGAPRRALRRFALRPVLAGAGAGAVPGIALGGPAWLALPVLVAAGAAYGLRAYRATGARVAGDIVVVREARRARRTLLVRGRRLQEHAVEHTPLQARARLADLRVTVGSGGEGRARHLDRATADELSDALRPRALA